MMPNVVLWVILVGAIPAPVFAATDIDLLTFDSLPAARPIMPEPALPVSDAEPLSVTVPTAVPVEIETAADPRPLPPIDVAPSAVKPVAAPLERTKPHAKAVGKPPAKPSVKPTVKAPINVPVRAAIKPPAEVAKPPVIPAAAPAEAQQDPLKAVVPHPEPAPVTVKPHDKPPELHPVPSAVIVPATISKPIAAGDRLAVVVAGETDLSGTYQVMPDGTVVLPLVGSVRAQGFSPDKFAEILTETLKDGYLVDPKITITTTGSTTDKTPDTTPDTTGMAP